MGTAIDAALLKNLLDLAIRIQQIPAPTFHEEQRAIFLRDLFLAESLCDVHIDDIGNVYARLPGKGKSRPLILSAHCDTVFSQHTDLSIRREKDKLYGAGIGDNSLGVAGLFGCLWLLAETGGQQPGKDGFRKSSLPGDVWLVANVGEEGLGDLRGMRAVVERFGKQVQAYVILEGMALGQIYHRGLEVKRYRLQVTTAGGHSWVDYGKPSAIHELAQVMSRIIQLSIPDQPRTTLNIGVIEGGTTVNSIAAQAGFELDLRSEDVSALNQIAAQVEKIVLESARHDVGFKLEVVGQRPGGQIPVGHPLISLARESLEAQGISPNLAIGSTDANLPLSHGLPAVCIGLTTGGGAHTLNEYISTAQVAQGLKQIKQIIQGAWRF